MYDIQNDKPRRTITVRMAGFFRLAEIQHLAADYRRETDSYVGEPHLVLADLRGLKAMDEESSKALGEAIAYGRVHGVVCCVHLTDTPIARMQVGRLAREANPEHDVTVEVGSAEQAQLVLTEHRAALHLKLGTA